MFFAALLSACGGGGGADSDPGAADPSATTQGVQSGEGATFSRLMPVSAVAATLPSLGSCDQSPTLPTVPSSYVSVRDFGARVDDDVDDAAAIQAAIDSAKSGQWVVFPPGRYIQSRLVHVSKPGVTLWGKGATLHATSSSSQALMLKADGVRVYGFTLTAVTEGRRSEPWATRLIAYGVDAVNGYIRGIVIQDNRLVAADGTVSSLSNSASAAGIGIMSVRDFTVADNVVERSLADGIHVTGASQNGRVLGNKVKETGDDMIAVVSYLDPAWRDKVKKSTTWLASIREKSEVRDVLISRNEVTAPYWGRGIAAVGGRNITISNNDVSRSAMAAGILIAREETSRTHGVDNVLVEANKVYKIQTESPTYVPTGDGFSALYAKLSVNGGRTGQGGIEIHNISNASDINDPTLYEAVKVSNVVVRNNDVDGVVREAIRVAADSQPGSISGVLLKGNRLANARVAPMAASFANGSPAIVQCEGNSYSGVPTTLSWCIAPRTPATVTGAMLSCSAF